SNFLWSSRGRRPTDPQSGERLARLQRHNRPAFRLEYADTSAYESGDSSPQYKRRALLALAAAGLFSGFGFEYGSQGHVALQGGLRIERPVDLTGEIVHNAVGLHHTARHLYHKRDRRGSHAAERLRHLVGSGRLPGRAAHLFGLAGLGARIRCDLTREADGSLVALLARHAYAERI